MVQIQNKPFQSEDDVIAFTDTWDQKDVTALPVDLIKHFPELLDGPRFVETVSLDCRGPVFGEEVSTSDTNSLAISQDGFQLMAVDQSGIALVRRIAVFGYEGVDVSTYSTMPILDAKNLRLTYLAETSIENLPPAMRM